jgi:polyisoprenoid-binding protein YceI
MFKRLLLAAALATASLSASAAGVTYTIDPGHTNVLASWNHFGLSHPSINFGEADGTITFDPDDVSKSSVQVRLPITGISALAANFHDHLSSAGWFDADNHPAATFRSTRVESAGKDRLKVTGDLTIKGITKPVVLDVVLNGRSEHPMRKVPAIGFDATATLKRSDFGLGRNVPAVSDEVTLRITTEAFVAAAK